MNAIDISARSIGNQYMARELQAAAQQVREGRALAAAMNDSGAFPDVAIKMVEVGESTGALQEMLNSLADFYDEEIETNLGRFVTLIEPLLLVIMGIVIAGLLLSSLHAALQLSAEVPVGHHEPRAFDVTGNSARCTRFGVEVAPAMNACSDHHYERTASRRLPDKLDDSTTAPRKRPPPSRRPRWRRRAGSPSATGSSSSTCRSSASTTSCSARFRRT